MATNTEVAVPTVINVYGTARSGSTMLDLMLGNAPRTFSCGEVSAWFRPYRTHHFTIECSCGRKPCPVWERIGYVPEHEFHATVARELGQEIIVDSSKDLCWLLDAQRWAERAGIRTFNLLIWKDPIDLAYSHWKRNQPLGEWRRDFVRSYGRFFATGLPFVSVNHAALVQDPQRTLGAICAAVGTECGEGRERFWDKEHHYLFGSLGVRRQAVARHSTMHATPSLAPEFEAHRVALQQQSANDSAVQEILAVLQRSDVESSRTSGGPRQVAWPRKLSPVWYHAATTLRRLRRYFPEPYDPAAP